MSSRRCSRALGYRKAADVGEPCTRAGQRLAQDGDDELEVFFLMSCTAHRAPRTARGASD